MRRNVTASRLPRLALALVFMLGAQVKAAVTTLTGPGDFSGPATTINFDQHPEGTATNSLYLSQGVEFYTNGSTVPIYDWNGIGRATTSGPNVVASVSGLNGSAFSSTIDLLFTAPTVEVGAYFGNDQLNAFFSQITLSLFDSSNALVGSLVVPTNDNTSVDQFIGLRSTTPFAWARFENAPAASLSVVLDDVMFTSVPEPSSAVLAVGAACGFWALARRRSRIRGR